VSGGRSAARKRPRGRFGPASPAAGRWNQSVLLAILLAIAAIAPFISSLGHEFAFDDEPILLQNEAVHHLDLKDIWTKPYWPARYYTARLYRPLAVTTFAIDWNLGGGKPPLFLAVNILLHLLTTFAVFRLLRRLFPTRAGIVWAATFLFAAHPIHVEAVAGIVGRSELLAALFTVLGYMLWLDSERDGRKGPAAIAAGLWLLALLSKESAVALPAFLFMHRIRFFEPASPRRLRRIDLVWPAALAVAILLRVHALGGLATPGATAIDNPLGQVGPFHRALGAGAVLGRQLMQVLLARRFSADYSYAEVDPGAPLYRTGAIVLIPFFTLIAFALLRGRRRPEGWGILFFLLAWIVTSNLLIPIGTVQADRLFYLPVLGLFVAGAGLIDRLARRLHAQSAAIAIAILLTVAYGARATVRTAAWRNNRTLFEAAVRDAPRSVKARTNLATQLLRDERPETARRALELLTPIAREGAIFGPYIQSQAKARMFLGESDNARMLFREALRHGADSAEVLIELGNLAIEADSGAVALTCFDLVRKTGKLTLHADIGHASALAVMGRFEEASEAWEPIVAEIPDSIPARTACAFNLRKAGRGAAAAELLRAGLALRQDPRLYEALARTLIDIGDAAGALAAAREAVRLDPAEENLTAFALASIAAGDRPAAVELRGRVHDPDFLSEIDDALRAAGR
jgi:tetratricopeptide (TPR) repeat protein